jgi:ATP-binding cassette subfamily G (WHITE) protein 2 (PDR)
MHSEFHGECTYHAESDVHIAHLTVDETLELSAKARTSHDELEASGKTWTSYAAETRNATLSALNMLSVVNTKIGNSFIPGISGGERRRAGIAEIMVGGSPFQCWDNSTRGLDSANALEFLRALRESTSVRKSVSLVSLYQASQDLYGVSCAWMTENFAMADSEIDLRQGYPAV